MSNNSLFRQPGLPPKGERDAGAVLAFVLVFFVFVGLTVTATLTFASTLMRNRPPINERNARVEAVRSAMRMAIQFQRDHGVGSCFQNSQTFVFNQGTSEQVSAQVNCSIGPADELSNNYFREGGDAYALITTIRDDSFPAISGSEVAGSTPTKLIEGNAFFAGGILPDSATPLDVLVGNETGGTPSSVLTTRLDGPRYEADGTFTDCDDPLVAAAIPSSGTVDGVAHSNNFQCTDAEWTERAGTRVAPATTWTYPSLPAIPANNRPAFNPTSFGFVGGRECLVIFPGRYDMPIDFDQNADYYLPSGVYYFTDAVTVSNGARVVAGQGRSSGCEVDSTVLLDPRTVDVESVAITGRGATFLLDDDASITVTDGSLLMNRRISTPSTRGSEGVSIRSVQTNTIDDADLFVPEDEVVTGVDSNGDRLLEDASTYVSNTNGTDVNYVGMNNPGVDDALVTVDFRGHSGGAFEVDGNIFIPQGKFALAADNPSYQISLDGGVVASRAEFNISAMPADPSDWYLGIDASPLLRRVELEATATINGKTARSVASFQVNSVGSYAINSWTVDPDGSVGGWTGSTTSGGSTSGTTTSGTTTSGSTAGTTTSGTTTSGSTAGTTTSGTTTSGSTSGSTAGSTTSGSTSGSTAGSTAGGSTAGGSTSGTAGTPCTDPTQWAGSYWDNQNLSGDADLVGCAGTDLAFDWVNAGPHSAVDHFSARATKTVDVPVDAYYDIEIGADDGVRMYIDGSLVYDRWVNKSFSTETISVLLTAGSHLFEVEYFENAGQAQLFVQYDAVPACAPDDAGWYVRYYNGTSLSDFKWDETDDPIGPNVNWGNGSPDRDELGKHTYSMEYSRTINFPEPGMYRFTTGSDDGHRLYINGNRVINQWQNGSYNGNRRTVEVDIQDRCQVLVELDFYENKGEARVSLEWEKI